jgi:hypothetical protein
VCLWDLEKAAKAGKPRLLTFPVADDRLACPEGGAAAADPLRELFEACSSVKIKTNELGQPEVAPVQEQQQRPSAGEVLAALARLPAAGSNCGLAPLGVGERGDGMQQQQLFDDEDDDMRCNCKQRDQQHYNCAAKRQEKQRYTAAAVTALQGAAAGLLSTGQPMS